MALMPFFIVYIHNCQQSNELNFIPFILWFYYYSVCWVNYVIVSMTEMQWFHITDHDNSDRDDLLHLTCLANVLQQAEKWCCFTQLHKLISSIYCTKIIRDQTYYTVNSSKLWMKALKTSKAEGIDSIPQPFYGPFSGTTRVSRCQKRTSGLYGARED